MKDLEDRYLDMLNEVSDERRHLIETVPAEADKFMSEVINEQACAYDFLYDQWKEK